MGGTYTHFIFHKLVLNSRTQVSENVLEILLLLPLPVSVGVLQASDITNLPESVNQTQGFMYTGPSVVAGFYFFFKILFFVCVYGCFACMLCVLHVCRAPGWWILLNWRYRLLSAVMWVLRNQIQVLWRSNQCSWLLSHLYSAEYSIV